MTNIHKDVHSQLSCNIISSYFVLVGITVPKRIFERPNNFATKSEEAHIIWTLQPPNLPSLILYANKDNRSTKISHAKLNQNNPMVCTIEALISLAMH